MGSRKPAKPDNPTSIFTTEEIQLLDTVESRLESLLKGREDLGKMLQKIADIFNEMRSRAIKSVADSQGLHDLSIEFEDGEIQEIRLEIKSRARLINLLPFTARLSKRKSKMLVLNPNYYRETSREHLESKRTRPAAQGGETGRDNEYSIRSFGNIKTFLEKFLQLLGTPKS